MNKYLKALIDSFNEEVKEADSRSWKHSHEGIVMYYKWKSTVEISRLVNETVLKTRKELRKLEKEGFIELKGGSNWLCWSAKNIEGFKQHQFNDYLCRDNS